MKSNLSGTVKRARFSSEEELKGYNNFRKQLGSRLVITRGSKTLMAVALEMQEKGISISKSSLGRYETGEALVDIYTLSQIAEFYHVSLDFLLSGKEMAPSDEIQYLLQGTSDEFQKFILDNMKHLIETTKEYYDGK